MFDESAGNGTGSEAEPSVECPAAHTRGLRRVSSAPLPQLPGKLLEMLEWLHPYVEEDGLFRIEAKVDEIAALVALISCNAPLSIAFGTSPHVVACAFKRVLRSHAPLFTYEACEALLAAGAGPCGLL